MTERSDDDVTIWAGRLRAWPAPDPDAGAPVEELDDATALRARRRAAPPDASTIARAGTPSDPAAVRAPHPPAESGPPPEATALRPRRAVRAPEPLAPDPTPDGRRVARVPDPAAREIYRPRAAQPEIVARSAPPPRGRQHPIATDLDASASGPARRSRRRWGAIALAGAAVVALGGAGAALLLALG